MKIRTKLYLVFAIVWAMVAVASAVNMLTLVELERQFQNLIENDLKRSELAQELRFVDAKLTASVRAFIIDPASKSTREEYDAAAAALDAAMTEAQALATSQEAVDIFNRISEINTRLMSIESELFAHPDIETAVSFFRGEYGDLESEYASLVNDFFELEAAHLVTRIDEFSALIGRTELTNLVLVGVLIVVSASLAFYISRSISNPLIRLVEVIRRITDGDMSQRMTVTTTDEIGILGQSFNEMTDRLQKTMASQVAKEYIEGIINQYRAFVARVTGGDLTTRLELKNGHHDITQDDLYQLGMNLNSMVESLSSMTAQIREAGLGIASAAAEILAATTQQIASATEQEAAVTQTMTTVEEVRTTVKQTAERAQTVADASRQSVEVSRGGQDSVSDAVTGMQLIRQRVESIAENILMLSERTQQIGEIIETVNEIADQSKLLALNASIEAARAGEEGKGFAVVAMEVRQLAEQSREATARVRDILGQIQQATNTAVMVTEEGSKGAESGVQLVEVAGDSITTLARTIESASQAAIQIAASTHQQTNGMDQLASAMLSIKQATSQTAASTRQAERSAQDLNELASQMQQAVARYQMN